MMYSPAGVLAVDTMFRVEVPVKPGVRLTPVRLNELVRPFALGEMDAAKATVPVNPRLFRVMVDVAVPPATELAGTAAPATRVKSGLTVTRTYTV